MDTKKIKLVARLLKKETIQFKLFENKGKNYFLCYGLKCVECDEIEFCSKIFGKRQPSLSPYEMEIIKDNYVEFFI